MQYNAFGIRPVVYQSVPKPVIWQPCGDLDPIAGRLLLPFFGTGATPKNVRNQIVISFSSPDFLPLQAK